MFGERERESVCLERKVVVTETNMESFDLPPHLPRPSLTSHPFPPPPQPSLPTHSLSFLYPRHSNQKVVVCTHFLLFLLVLLVLYLLCKVVNMPSFFHSLNL